MFGELDPGADIVMLAENAGNIRSAQGPASVADASILGYAPDNGRGRAPFATPRMPENQSADTVLKHARVSSFEEPGIGSPWVARLKSPPVDGKANEELIALIAERFVCRKSAVSIKSGASGRIKLVQINCSP